MFGVRSSSSPRLDTDALKLVFECSDELISFLEYVEGLASTPGMSENGSLPLAGIVQGSPFPICF